MDGVVQRTCAILLGRVLLFGFGVGLEPDSARWAPVWVVGLPCPRGWVQALLEAGAAAGVESEMGCRCRVVRVGELLEREPANRSQRERAVAPVLQEGWLIGVPAPKRGGVRPGVIALLETRKDPAPL